MDRRTRVDRFQDWTQRPRNVDRLTNSSPPSEFAIAHDGLRVLLVPPARATSRSSGWAFDSRQRVSTTHDTDTRRYWTVEQSAGAVYGCPLASVPPLTFGTALFQLAVNGTSIKSAPVELSPKA